mgnify:CR=1 FL=1
MRRVVLLVLVAMALASCGGDSSDPPGTMSATASDPTSIPATTAPPESDDPAALGGEIGALYLQGYEDVIALLADRPDPEAATVALADLKESYIQQMVAFGYRREALDDAGRVAVDAAIMSALRGLDEETFAAYSQASSDYSGDPGVAALIGDFNIIGQYANFDLLREQDPEEAARLGVG